MTGEVVRKTRRKGATVYDRNPFVEGAALATRSGIRRITNTAGDRMMVVSQNSGEVMAPAGFWTGKTVDETKFVKLYVNGVKAFKELSGAGARVFEVLYLEMQKSVGKDRVYMSFLAIEQNLTPMSETTYMRGMRELVDKQFLATSHLPGWYFINPDYVWNGDRLAFVTEYRKANDGPKRDPLTIDAFTGVTDAEQQGLSLPLEPV